MINVKMQNYDYYLYGDMDDYGQPVLSEKQGTVRMAVYIANHVLRDTVQYSNCSFIGLTSHVVTDRYVFDYNGTKLKVLYVNTQGRLNQVYLGEM